MRSRRTSIGHPAAARAALACLALGAAWSAAGCRGGGEVGEACDTMSDCADELQCLSGVCVSRCDRHTECGDGHICRDDGVCEQVESEVGALCAREMDCAPGQACALLDEDIDDDGWLTAACAPEHPGGVLDTTCTTDDDCRSGTCALGRCVTVCVDDEDCAFSHRCTDIPRALPTTGGPSLPWAMFRGCLPVQGNLRYQIPFAQTFARFLLPVPSRARSVSVVSTINDPQQLVGATNLESPTGEILYALPPGPDTPEYFAQRVRHYPTVSVSTLILPQSPDDPLVKGMYTVDLGSFRALPSPLGTKIPHVEAIYKLDNLNTLDLRFHFLELGGDHPCRAAFGPDEVLNADVADDLNHPFQREYLAELGLIFASAAGIIVGNVTYDDLPDLNSLDGLDAAKLGTLLSQSTQVGGLDIYVVRTIAPSGLQALVGGPPAPPGTPRTAASGVAISADALCYRTWKELARTTAHELARAMGLARAVEPTGEVDTIEDSDTSIDNLMYFGEGGSTTLSPGQRTILRNSPVLR